MSSIIHNENKITISLLGIIFLISVGVVIVQRFANVSFGILAFLAWVVVIMGIIYFVLWILAQIFRW